LSGAEALSGDFFGFVILRACDFFVFPQKWTLKTNGLRTKKSRKFKKVTNSERRSPQRT
jgi:hypothetical protein